MALPGRPGSDIAPFFPSGSGQGLPPPVPAALRGSEALTLNPAGWGELAAPGSPLEAAFPDGTHCSPPPGGIIRLRDDPEACGWGTDGGDVC